LASIGSVGALVQRSMRRTIEVALRGSLADPGGLFESLPCVSGWRSGRGPGVYLLDVDDVDAAAPEVARAVVWSGLSLVGLTESGRSLEEAYLDIVEGGP